MSQYLTYEEYTQYGGELPETDFTLAEFKARSRIDYLTDCRVQSMAEVPEAVKLAIMAIIKVDSAFSATSQASNPLVASYSTDGYSESYGSGTEQATAANNALNDEINRMLYGVNDDNGVPLLYRGLM